MSWIIIYITHAHKSYSKSEHVFSLDRQGAWRCLRFSFSHLKEFKFKHNFGNSAYLLRIHGNGVESTTYSSLYFANFKTQRQTLLSKFKNRLHHRIFIAIFSKSRNVPIICRHFDDINWNSSGVFFVADIGQAFVFWSIFIKNFV